VFLVFFINALSSIRKLKGGVKINVLLVCLLRIKKYGEEMAVESTSCLDQAGDFFRI
jgi:hypothetical protein